MLKISQSLSESKRTEKIIFSCILLSLLFTSILNCFMSVEILKCSQIGDFLALFDSFWINQALISKIVLRLMQFVYATDSVIFIILSSFSIFDYLVFFGSILFLLQLSFGGKLKLHQNWIRLLFVIRLVGLVILLIFLFFAITSLTTAKGFFHLKAGAVGYLFFNSICIILVVFYMLSKLKSITR